nr:MAG TPA: hypothetical protein [Caudoviricetes sp.]
MLDGTWSGFRCRDFPTHHIRPEFLKCGLANIKHTFWNRLLVIRARFISSEINKLLAEA